MEKQLSPIEAFRPYGAITPVALRKLGAYPSSIHATHIPLLLSQKYGPWNNCDLDDCLSIAMRSELKQEGRNLVASDETIEKISKAAEMLAKHSRTLERAVALPLCIASTPIEQASKVLSEASLLRAAAREFNKAKQSAENFVYAHVAVQQVDFRKSLYALAAVTLLTGAAAAQAELCSNNNAVEYANFEYDKPISSIIKEATPGAGPAQVVAATGSSSDFDFSYKSDLGWFSSSLNRYPGSSGAREVLFAGNATPSCDVIKTYAKPDNPPIHYIPACRRTDSPQGQTFSIDYDAVQGQFQWGPSTSAEPPVPSFSVPACYDYMSSALSYRNLPDLTDVGLICTKIHDKETGTTYRVVEIPMFDQYCPAQSEGARFSYYFIPLDANQEEINALLTTDWRSQKARASIQVTTTYGKGSEASLKGFIYNCLNDIYYLR